MNFKSFKLNASTLCAGGSMLVLSGFLALNLAGCGGGGGGGSTSTKTAKNVTIRLLNSSGEPVLEATLQLARNGTTYDPISGIQGAQLFNELPFGTYQASVDFDGSGPKGSEVKTLTIVKDENQNYALVEGNPTDLVISGKTLINPRADGGDPDSNYNTPNCAQVPVPLTAEVIISVRDLSKTGNPIITSIVRSDQGSSGDGTYSISLPYRPTTFRAEVTRSSGSSSPSQFAGYSATATFPPGENAITNLNICSNENGTPPQPVPATPIPQGTATPLVTATSTPDPSGATATAAAQATATAVQATATAVAGATATAAAQATATAGPGATATAGPGATATAIAGAGPTATAVAQATATASALATNTPLPGGG